MKEYLPYIVFGLVAGSVYGISAMGLVLTYKTSGVFNFAHGAVCASAAYAFYDLRQLHGVPWPVAALLVVVIFGAVLGLLLERLALAVANVTTVYKVVATVGLLVAIRSIVIMRYGGQGLFFEPFLPQDEAANVQGVSISYDNIINLLLGIAAAIGLYLFFRLTRLGTAMRGVVDDPTLLDMTGASPVAVRRAAWVIGSMFAAASGVLFASVQQQLDVNILSLLVVQAFGAAAIGLFRSLPMCFVGGIVVGLAQKLAGKEVGDHSSLQGLDTNMPFIVLFLILIVAKREQLVEVGRNVKERAVPESAFPVWLRTAGYAVLAVVVLAAPAYAGTKLAFYNTAMTQVILFLSLGLLVRTSGQISLCHIGLAAIGAAGFGHMLNHGVPWGLALIIGGLVVVPVAALIAIPAIRLSGLYLALLTLGFNIFLAQYAFGKDYMFGFGLLETRRPEVWGLAEDTHYYYLLTGIAFLCLLIVLAVERSRLGRLLRGLSDSPAALATLGASVNVSRTIVFCISGFLAGISGALFASLFGGVNQDSFNYLESLIILAILAISGRRTATAAIVAAALYKVAPGYTGDVGTWLDMDPANVQHVLNIGFGLAAIAVAALSQGQLGKALASSTAKSQERVNGPQAPRLEAIRERQRMDHVGRPRELHDSAVH